VLSGFYTGRQQVFAFPSGRPPSSEWPWLIVLGWGVIGGLAVLFARLPAFRRTVARYFTAHGFYRDAIREGRETIPGVNLALFVAVAVALGIVASAAARALDPLPSTTLVLEALPDSLGTTLGTWIRAPGLVGVGVGTGCLLLLGAWTLALASAAQEWNGLGVDQTLMLVAWACWPALPAMIVALVSAAQAPATAAAVAGLLLLAGGIASVWMVVRVLLDYVAVSKTPPGIATALGVLSPPVLGTIALVVIVLRYEIALSFLWHLATQT
jgi:hypothetical protein